MKQIACTQDILDPDAQEFVCLHCNLTHPIESYAKDGLCEECFSLLIGFVSSEGEYWESVFGEGKERAA